MIDTVILSVPRYQVKNKNGGELLTSTWTSGFPRWIKNAEHELTKNGKYYPRLTGFQAKSEWTINIEFSAPKLLLGNNLEELETSDLGKLVRALNERLLEMGIQIDKKNLYRARVSSVHFSKNIEIKNGQTSQYIIRELSKVNTRKNLDNTRFRFMNNGESIQIYSNAHSFVIYDKIADLEKPTKRGIDKDANWIFKQLPRQNKHQKEILRLEVRLAKYKKVRSVLESVNFRENLTLNQVFNSGLSKKVVTLYWRTLIEGSEICFLPYSDPKQVLEIVHLKYPKLNGTKKIQIVGMWSLASNANGLTEIRAILYKNKNRSWYRLVELYKELSETLSNESTRDWVAQIETELEKYEKYKINKM